MPGNILKKNGGWTKIFKYIGSKELVKTCNNRVIMQYFYKLSQKNGSTVVPGITYLFSD
jgi:hypothetical protein